MKGCRTCRHWQGVERYLERVDPATAGKKVQLGLCRRHAPQPSIGADGADADDMAGARGRWPAVASDDWCGEWEPNMV
ncbi:MAG: hypothetical protein ACE5DS_05875 [Kiloniellaceae bacterium]